MPKLLDEGESICNDRFTVERFLGRGSIGEGYRCRDGLLQTQVVCKVGIDTSDATWSEFRLQFEKLNSMLVPAVVRPLGFDRHEGHPVVVLEWIDGGDLEQWVAGKPLKARLDALASIAQALVSIHAAGMTHGDLWGGVNVIATPGRGCVLIDPQPNLWGATSRSTEARTDISSLVFLVGHLAPEYVSGRLAPMVASLTQDPRDAALRSASEQLRSVAQAVPILPGSEDAHRAAGQSYQEKVRLVNERYKINRLLRSNMIKQLAAGMEAAAQPFGLRSNISAVDERLEAARDSEGLGYFLQRHVWCSSPWGDDSRFAISFDAVEDFGKAWPYGGGTIAIGEWSVTAGRRGGGNIELTVGDDDVPRFFVNRAGRRNVYPRPVTTPDQETMEVLDDEWLRNRVADLVNA